MKKKGLLISTIVMVVVLIAALTTSTYAWFEASSVAKVSDISMEVGATSNVQIGMRASNSSGTSVINYKNGNISFTNGDLNTNDSNSNNGLGTTLDTGLALNVTGGVGSASNSSGTLTMDNLYNSNNTLYKANGSDFAHLGVPELAVINGNGNEDGKTDVIDFNMGIRAAKDDIYGTYGKIVVSIPKSQSYVGMIAALHVEISVGTGDSEKTYDGGDVFGNVHYDTQLTGSSDNVQYVFYFMIDEVSTNENPQALSPTGNVTPFSIKMFISGYDTDCNNDATGTSATISLEFDGCNSTSWEADTSWTKLVLKSAS